MPSRYTVFPAGDALWRCTVKKDPSIRLRLSFPVPRYSGRPLFLFWSCRITVPVVYSRARNRRIRHAL